MGWDAHSSAEMSKGRKFQLKHKRQREAFKAASDRVRAVADSVDGYLDNGSLDVSLSRDMLQKATGESCYSDWPAERVKALAESANWHFRYKKADAWAYHSAKEFLNTCAELGLSVTFSY